MKFAYPLWLLAGAVALAAMFWIYRRFDRRQRAALADFASHHLLAKLTASFSPGRRRIKRLLFVCAVGLSFVALARPQWGYHWEEQKRRGIDILFAIDTSKSMLTQDVNPDRITRAKLAITDLVNKLDGDRVGLIAFAGDAFLQAPLTLDYDAFQESLDATGVGVIPRGGTDIASAIQEAQVAFSKESRNRKILVLITDGEDLDAKGVDAAHAAAANGLKIYTIGVGSAAGGLIPVPGANGGTDFVKDASGQFVKSHLDENTLKQIAEATGGSYEPLGQQGQGLVTLYNQALAPLPKQELASRSQKVYDERFQAPLAGALICLLGSLMIGTRKTERRLSLRRTKNVSQPVSLLGVLALLLSALNSHASPQAAEQEYKKGNYSTAEKQYELAAATDPQAAPLQFDVGAAAYKTADYDKALPAFQKALGTDQIGVQQQAYYNIGNTQYRVGQKTEKTQPQTTIKTWQGAVQSYDAALKLKPADADAKFNRDFVQKKLDQLQQQQRQQDQKNQQQNQQNKDQQQKQNSPQNQQSQDQKSGGSPEQNQSQGDQPNQKDQKGSSGSQSSEAQNGKPGQQQKQGDQSSGSAQNGAQGQPKDQSSGQQQQTASGGQNQPKPGSGQTQPNQQNAGSLAQNGEKQAGPRGQTIPDKGQPSKQDQASADDAQSDQAGQMSKQEAKDLLNSLKGNEHALSVTADGRTGGNHAPDEQPLKDW
jgi:Ca-activated chloride channel family protein